MEHFAWPICVSFLGLIFLFIFRRQIGELLERTRKISRTGIECESAKESPQPVEASDGLRFRELMSGVDSPAVRQVEQNVRDVLIQKGVTDDKQLAEVLINNVAASFLAIGFERIHSQIYGTQIALLQLLNASGPMPPDQVQKYYANVSTTYSGFYARQTPEQYIGFLTAMQLVADTERGLAITDNGREFLVYIAKNGLAVNRAF